MKKDIAHTVIKKNLYLYFTKKENHKIVANLIGNAIPIYRTRIY